MQASIRKAVLNTLLLGFLLILFITGVTALIFYFLPSYASPSCCRAYYIDPSGTVQNVLGTTSQIGVNTPRDYFASRWSGDCYGWSFSLNILFMVSDFLVFTSYILVGMVLIRFHPTFTSIKYSKTAINLAILIFWTCGYDHLLSAFCHLKPYYWDLGYFKVVEATVGLLGAFYIAFALADRYFKIRKELLDKSSKLHKLEQKTGVSYVEGT